MKLYQKYILFVLIFIIISVIYIFTGNGFSINNSSFVILHLRFPRYLLAIMTGAILAFSGAMIQGVLRNPLADPYLLGISGGAVLGNAIAGLIVPGNVPLSILLSFIGGFSAFAATLFISGLWKGNRQYSTIIAGIMTGTFSSSAVALIYVFSKKGPGEYFYAIMGTLNVMFYRNLIPLYLLIIAVLLLLIFIMLMLSKEMDVISSGYDIAETSGISVRRTVYTSLTISAFLVSAVVAFAGVIGFVGIMVPHLIRRLSPAKHLHIYLLSLLGGAILLLFADVIVRNVFVFEIPVGIITSLIGIPFFIYVLKKGNND